MNRSFATQNSTFSGRNVSIMLPLFYGDKAFLYITETRIFSPLHVIKLLLEFWSNIPTINVRSVATLSPWTTRYAPGAVTIFLKMSLRLTSNHLNLIIIT